MSLLGWSLLATACGRDAKPTGGPTASDPAEGSATAAKTATVVEIASGSRPTATSWTSGVRAKVQANPERAARAFVQDWARANGRPKAHRAELSAGVVTGRPGRQVVRFDHHVGGIPIWLGRTSVLLSSSGTPAAVSGFPEGGAVLGAFQLSSEQAALLAWRRHRPEVEVELVLAGTRPAGDTFELAAGPSVSLFGPILASRVYFRSKAGLVPAYSVALGSGLGASDQRGEEIVVSAADGSILSVRHTLFGAHSYRVWTAADGTPAESPLASILPYPAAGPSGIVPAAAPSTLTEVDGLNHNPDGEADPWLAANATTTSGNNIDAYVDFDDPDGLSGPEFRAGVTSPGVFDQSYDLSLGPLANDTQSEAAIVQAFYTTNWLHDWYYDSGFDEVARNGQADNYGRGGFDADVVHVELQDAATSSNPQRNNANMYTPPDGVSPVMQVYVWTAPMQSSIVASPGGPYPSATATFGPTTFDVSGQLVAVNDGTADTMDACQAVTQDLTGKVALIRRGGNNCPFADKVSRAENAGAIGVVIANNVGGAPPAMSGTLPGAIPTLSTTQEGGDELVAALAAGAVTVQLSLDNAPERDGALDGTIVAHEWGHYLQERLAPCAAPEVVDNGGNPYALPTQCYAMGEGGGDFVALHMLLGEDDDPALAYPMAAYAAASQTPDLYYGLRRYPYSTSLDINPLTFRFIADGPQLPAEVPGIESQAPNAEVHNAGEIWAAMLFEAYAAMLAEAAAPGDDRTFADVRRSMSDDLVLGLAMMPAERTVLDSRDALLAAIALRSTSDAVAAAEGFAKRGAGTCAEGPAFDSTDNLGVVEDFEVHPKLEVGLVLAEDSKCDNDEDGVLDAGETGTLTVEIVNLGPALATDTTVSVAGLPPELRALEGTQTTVDEVPALGTAIASFPVSLDDISQFLTSSLTITVENEAGCTPSIEAEREVAMNYDVDEAGAQADDFSTDTGGWSVIGPQAGAIWERTGEGSDAVWHGDDYEPDSSTALVSPPLEVSETEPFQVTFSHRYSFEETSGNADPALNAAWDGAIVEVSLDDGATWQDAADISGVDPNYSGSITNASNNPLTSSGTPRPAYVGNSPGYPGYDSITIDFGTELAGETVRVAFRIGTDALGSAPGWDIDDVTFAGTDPGPFVALVADTTPAAPCPEPVATGGSGTGGAADEDGGSSATDGAGGDGDGTGASAGSGGQGNVDAPGGCGCRVTGARPSPFGAGAAGLVGLALLLRRRRSQPTR